MFRTLHLIAIAFALGIANLVWAAPPSGSNAQSVERLFRLRFRVYATVPAGSVIICKARLDGGGAKSGPDEAVASAAAVGASSSLCVMEIPLSWTGKLPGNVEVLCYEIETEEHPGMVPKRIAAGTASLPTMSSEPGDLDFALQISSAR